MNSPVSTDLVRARPAGERRTSEGGNRFRRNNFDLIRLFAASQVVYFHCIDNLGIAVPGILAPLSFFLGLFPGVPIFFVISGYLISMSYERSGYLLEYGLNRFLRIFPALWVCFLATLCTITLSGAWTRVHISAGKMLTWILMQLTIGQFYSPHVINANYGVGNPNGSLWTIPVELQFYIILPLLYSMIFVLRKKNANAAILTIILSFLGLQQIYLFYGPRFVESYETLAVLARVTFVPWVYMFLVGVLIQRNKSLLARFTDGKAGIWLAAYILISSLGASYFDMTLGNYLNPFLFVILAITVVSCAETCTGLSSRLLGGNDISYGTYIYHMVVVNLIYEIGHPHSAMLIPTVFAATFVCAYLSWRFIERPALALKRHALRPM